MKRTLLCIVVIVLLLSIALGALAVTTVGPNVYATLMTGTKASTSAEPRVVIAQVTLEGTNPFRFWIRHNDSGTQVSPSYKIYDGDTGLQSEMYYKTESRDAGYVVAGDQYAARVRSHEDTLDDETGTISLSSFAP